MKKFSITVNGQAYEVEVEEVGAGAAAAAPVAAPEELPDAKTLVIALPLEELAHWKAAAAGKAERCVVFTGAKVGCGVGACRGCFIHCGPVSTGIAVCQEGPFLPIETVDYAKDQNFLGHYV